MVETPTTDTIRPWRPIARAIVALVGPVVPALGDGVGLGEGDGSEITVTSARSRSQRR